MAKKSNTLLIGGLIAGGGLLWWLTSRQAVPGAASAAPVASPGPGLSNTTLNYLQAYAADKPPNYALMVNNVDNADLGTLYTIVHDYFETGIPLPASLTGQWNTFTQVWGLT